MKNICIFSLVLSLIILSTMCGGCGGSNTTTQPQTPLTTSELEPTPQSSTTAQPTTITIAPSAWEVTIQEIEIVPSLGMRLAQPINRTTQYYLSDPNKTFLIVGFSLVPNTEENFFDFKEVTLIKDSSVLFSPVGLHTGSSGSSWIMGTSGSCNIEIISANEAKLECDLEFSEDNNFGIKNDSLTGNSNSFSSTLTVTQGPLFTFAYVVPLENAEDGDYWLQLPASQPVELDVTNIVTTTTLPTTATSTIPDPKNTTQPEPLAIEASDGNVSIAIEDPIRADTLPLDIMEALQKTYPQFESPSPNTGSDFVCVYLTLVNIENIHLTDALGFKDEKSILITEDDNEYEPCFGSIKGIKFQDPHDIQSPFEYIEGATGFLVFEVPKSKALGEIHFIYSFKETWEGELTRGQIDITYSSHIEKAIGFLDANLELAIREAINKPTGEILTSDLASLVTLTASESNILNISGLEYCINLEYLDLFGNRIGDISPIAELNKLKTLYLYQNSNISDISSLGKLINLEVLKLGQNNISDISNLSGLVNLQVLYLPGNNIEDISPITGLGDLTLLVLINNNISNISPLIESAGLSSGDTIDIRGNPLNTDSLNTYIPQLIAKGVNVIYLFDD